MLAAAEADVELPLLPLPPLEDIAAELAEAEGKVAAAEAAGASESELRILRYHGASWARRAYEEIAGGEPRTSAAGSVSAIRIGDAAIVTGPGEVFTEIGLAVKERSPADVTFYAGYSNGCISYLPTAAEYPLGGYEPSYGHKTYGLPAQVSPETERILVETGVRLVTSLFPERHAPAVDGWLATGALPTPRTRPLPSPGDRRLTMQAGSATIGIAPPLGLPMIGFVRRQEGATAYGLPLEANALVLESVDELVVLCNVDTLGFDEPEIGLLRQEIADLTGVRP